MSLNKSKKGLTNHLHSLEGSPSDLDCDEPSVDDKMMVECVCPRCGEKHFMKFRWTGRGTPRKFCFSCRGSFDS